MSDSDDGMFGESSEDNNKEQQERMDANSPPPEYVHGDEFKQF